MTEQTNLSNYINSKSSQVKITGKVIKIVKNPHQNIIGTIISGKLKPRNKYLPQCNILNTNAINNQNDIIYVTRFIEWNHGLYPIVEIMSSIDNKLSTIETESRIILLDNNIEQIHINYDKQLEQQINTQYELNCHNRLNLIQECIFTIDPDGSNDLDDAISIKQISEHQYQIGVHITDVSVFIKPDTIIDNSAMLNVATVYLPHRRINMLPTQLSEGLLSLLLDQERLAISIYFNVDYNGMVDINQQPQIHKSIVKSKAQLNYKQITQIVNNQLQDKIMVASNINIQDLYRNIKSIHRLSNLRHQIRLKEGLLDYDINDFEIYTTKDDIISGFQLKSKSDHLIVEEWMVLANYFVAKQLSKKDNAILITQASPTKLDKIHQIIKPYNCTLEQNANSFKIVQIINVIQQSHVSEVQKYFAINQLTKLQEPKQWTTSKSGQDQRHFSMNLSVYTNFTSPLRKYLDLLVHRQIHIQLEQDRQIFQEQQLQQYQIKYKTIRKVQQQCTQTAISLYLQHNPQIHEAYVKHLGYEQLQIYIPYFDIYRIIEFNSIKNILSYKYISEDLCLLLTYQDPTQPNGRRLYIIQCFDKIKVQLSGSIQSPFECIASIVIQVSINWNQINLCL